MSSLKSRLHRLLRWSEKYTKTDMVYLAKSGGWSFFGSVVTIAIGATTFLAFTNWLSKEDYGTYQYILSIADLFGIFVLAGIDTAVTRSVARGKDGALIDGLTTKIRWGLIGGIGAIALGTYYLAHANATLGWGFVIAGFFIPFWEAPGIYGTYLQGKRRFDLATVSDIILQSCTALVLVPTLFFTQNILIILFLYLLTVGLTRTGLLIYSLRKVPSNDEHDPDMIPYGKHLTLMTVITTIASSTDTLLLWHLLGPASVALYTIAQAIPGRANGFLKIFNRLAFPKIAASEPEYIRRTLMRKVWMVIALSSFCALAYVMVVPYIFAFFIPRYLAAVPYTMLAAVLIAVQPFSLISSSLTAQAKKVSLYIWSIGAPLMRIGLFLVLIPIWGLWGAMIALVSAKTLEGLLLIGLFYRL